MILQQHKLHIFLITFMVPNIVEAEGFVRLTGLPGSLQNDLSTAGYINALYILSISVAAFLAVARIILAGVQYMLTDVVTTKGEARKQITSALLGLLIVLGAVLILETINPQLTNWNALDNIPKREFSAQGGVNVSNAEFKLGSSKSRFANEAEAKAAAELCGGSNQGLVVTCPTGEVERKTAAQNALPVALANLPQFKDRELVANYGVNTGTNISQAQINSWQIACEKPGDTEFIDFPVVSQGTVYLCLKN